MASVAHSRTPDPCTWQATQRGGAPLSVSCSSFVRRAARSPEVAKARAATLKAICNISCQTPHVYYWHAELGAGGKDYRADFVHAPFPKILSSRMP